MIDTIKLVIPTGYEITNHNAFTPNSSDLFVRPYRHFVGREWWQKSIQNPTRNDGYYKPQLTIWKYTNDYQAYPTLKIQLSLPKLVYGHNFYELNTIQFNDIIDLLQVRLLAMGVRIEDKNIIKQAMVETIHYSKNIILPNGITCSMVLKEIEKANPNSFHKLDTERTNFRNGGQMFRYHCNSYEVTFYDKIQDLRQVSISRERTYEQYLDSERLFITPDNIDTNQNVLRIEVRLNTRNSINTILHKAGIRLTDIHFMSLFKDRLSKRIINYFWNDIVANIPPRYNVISDEELFSAIDTTNVKTRGFLFGLIKLQQIMSAREFENILYRYVQGDNLIDKSRNVRAILTKLRNCNVRANTTIPNTLSTITQTLENYIPITADNSTVIRRTEIVPEVQVAQEVQNAQTA